MVYYRRLEPEGTGGNMFTNSHRHIDHSGGLRAFVAEGARIITHEMNRDWLERVLKAVVRGN